MKKILVVDDIATNRRLLNQMLVAINNYAVIEAENGMQAIDLYVKENPDLILMDINMPDMDGFQATSTIKDMMGGRFTPIIFVTALSESSLSNALASGGDDFVSKPFDVEVLASKINAHLRIRELNLKLNDTNQKLIHEQELIEHFFESALSQSFLDPRYVNYHMSSLSTFNGDVLLVEKGPKGGLFVVMGDFTGHGLTAAMGTLPVAMLFFKMVAEGGGIKEIVKEINCQLNKLLPTGMFFAATVIEITPDANNMSVWMGSMPEIYWFAKGGELKGEICSHNMALGVLKDEEFEPEIENYAVDKGDKIYLYSDGVIEAKNSGGKMFGNSRLKSVLEKHSQNRFNSTLDELKSYRAKGVQSDDITFVELICNELID